MLVSAMEDMNNQKYLHYTNMLLTDTKKGDNTTHP